MAFDRTNPTDLLALQTELNTDPIGMGYASVNNNNVLTTMLNDPDQNVGGDTVSREFDAYAMLDALDPTELDDQQTNAFAANYSHMLLEISTFNSIEDYKSKWRSMFQANSNTVVALDAQVRALSRAEVLFGTNTVLVKDDVAAALNYIP